MVIVMITSRFHKEDAEIQRNWTLTRLKRRRLLVLTALALAAFALFAAAVLLLGGFSTSPLLIPVYPALLAPLALGLAAMGAGAYFKKKLLDLAPPHERPPLRSRFARVAAVWIVLSGIVLVFFLPLSPLAPGDNYVESALVSQGRTNVSAENFVKLHFQGRDALGASRAELDLRSLNNVSLNYYLLQREDAEAFESDHGVATASYDHAENRTKYSFRGDQLDAGEFTLVIVNEGDAPARIQYTITHRTSDELSTAISLFFLSYILIAAGWLGYLRSSAKRVESAPAPSPAPIGPPGAPAYYPQPAQALPGPPVAPERGMAQAAPQALQEPVPAPAPGPGAAGVKQVIDCPRCRTRFEVLCGTGPTRIRCPTCGKEGTLAGVPLPAPAAAPPQAPPMPAGYLESSPAPPGLYAPQAPEVETVQMGAPPPPPGYAALQPQATAQTAPVYPPPQPYQLPQPPSPPPTPELAAPPPPPPEAPPPTVVEKRTIACPRCKGAFQIDKVEGPQHVRCPHCGKEGTIGKRPAAQVPPAAPGPAPPSPQP
ncbi:MAG: hypothetical protein ACUVV6_03510, partial [Thermoplasmatota archaeon]